MNVNMIMKIGMDMDIDTDTEWTRTFYNALKALKAFGLYKKISVLPLILLWKNDSEVLMPC
jgi:hypothetical protein